jgi:hypothetical protein
MDVGRQELTIAELSRLTSIDAQKLPASNTDGMLPGTWLPEIHLPYVFGALNLLA